MKEIIICIIKCLFLQLLEKKKRVQLKDVGEDLECLCQIMRTVGPKLDHEKARVSIRKKPHLVLNCFGLLFFLTRHSPSSL